MTIRSKGPGKGQLSLFMSGEEWKASVTNSVDRHFKSGGRYQPKGSAMETMDDVWERKENEARQSKHTMGHGAGLYDAMSKGGYDHDASPDYDKPTIWTGFGPNAEMTQGEGHHRVAAAAAVERDTGKKTWIPTSYEPG